MEKNKTLETSTEIPKIIWTFWNNTEIPPIVNKCIESIKKKNPNYQLNVLNMNNLNNFFDEKEIYDILNWKYNNNIQKLSDLIRFSILTKYGGIWVDASIICYDSFDRILLNTNKSCIVYERPVYSTTPVIETWFIACNKNNKFINDWNKEFKKASEFDDLIDYVNYINDDLSGIEDIDYLLVYIPAKKLYLKYENEIELIPAIEGPRKFIFDKKWVYSLYEKEKRPIFAKLTHGDRDFIKMYNIDYSKLFD